MFCGLVCLLLWLPALAANTLSQTTYQSLLEIDQLINKNSHPEALKQGLALLPKTRSNYEKAVVRQRIAMSYSAQNQLNPAIAQLQQATQLSALPKPLNHQLTTHIGQLYLSLNNYKQAAVWLNKAINSDELNTAQLRVQLASAYGQMGQYPAAIEQLNRAIKQQPPGDENWGQLLIWLHFQTKNYNAAIKPLQQLVERFPNKRRYWQQLSQVYLSANNPQQALATLELAHQKQLFRASSDYLDLATLYAYLGAPRRAAAILEAGLLSGNVDANEQNQNQLSDYQHLARKLP